MRPISPRSARALGRRGAPPSPISAHSRGARVGRVNRRAQSSRGDSAGRAGPNHSSPEATAAARSECDDCAPPRNPRSRRSDRSRIRARIRRWCPHPSRRVTHVPATGAPLSFDHVKTSPQDFAYQRPPLVGFLVAAGTPVWWPASARNIVTRRGPRYARDASEHVRNTSTHSSAHSPRCRHAPL